MGENEALLRSIKMSESTEILDEDANRDEEMRTFISNQNIK